MQVHLLGHASLFVETEDCKILIDPVLEDPFCEGLNEACPKREVLKDNLPEYDFLIISHRHLDHFDLRSLAYLPKNVDVLIPQDNLIKDCLLQLGYSQIYPLADFTKVRSGSTMMMTTRSEIRVPEFGIVIKDSSGVFWNTVDTYFAPQTIAKVREFFPEIDFLLTTWHISLESKYQYNQSVSFPYELYSYLLKLIEAIEPKAIAPGAQGFKYIGGGAWQNNLVFPQTREKFCQDLEVAFPNLKETIFPFDPGDIISFDRGKYKLLQQASPYAKMTIDDRQVIDFTPVIAGNPLVDSNSEQYNGELMKREIKQEISVNLPQFINKNLESLFYLHQQWNVIYQLTIVFSDCKKQWYVDFSQSAIEIKLGRNPLANYFTYITASTLYSLIKRDRDWDYALCNGEYRTWQKIYSWDKANLKYPQNIDFSDPIQLLFSSEYVAEQNIYRELNSLSKLKEKVTVSSPSMLNLGNILIKKKNTPKATTKSSSLVKDLNTIESAITPAIINQNNWHNIKAISSIFPQAITNFFGFEYRLSNDDAYTDFLLCIDAAETGKKILGDPNYKLKLPQKLLEQSEWQQLTNFGNVWCQKDSPLDNLVHNVWLEFDLDSEVSNTPIPSVFFGLSPSETETNFDWVTDTALPLLLDRPVSANVEQGIKRCFATIPIEAHVFQIGLMLSRQIDAVRLCIRNLKPQEIVPFLQSMEWQGDKANLSALLEELAPFVDRIDLDIDVGDGIYPKIGLECYLTYQPSLQPKWKLFFAYLVKSGLCTESKQQKLLNYPGFDRLAETDGKLKLEHLIGRKQETILFRGLHHIKLSYKEDRVTEAKAYLYASRSQIDVGEFNSRAKTIRGEKQC